MKRASYREGVRWIAFNDDEETVDADEIAGFISTALLADLFNVTTERVARDVARIRKENA